VSDVASGSSEQELADLCALADGSLPAERRAEVEARVAASGELQELLERQQQAVLAVRALARDDVPESLRAGVEARRGARGSRRGRARLVPRLALAGAIAVIAAVVAAVVLSGGPGAPSVADAARLATRPPTGPPPAAAGSRLGIGLGGVSFPAYARAYGWRAIGIRKGRVDGRDAIVVVYGKGNRRLGYAIVAGAGLPRPEDARSTVIRGVRYQTLRLEDLLAVTWRRGGHTCVLIGEAPRAELLRLASWPLSSPR
jgi:anti-sigma factor RsiW